MYRTANIQAIDAVGKDRIREMELEMEANRVGCVDQLCATSPSKPDVVFPNKDIEKDFKVLCNMNLKALDDKDGTQKCLTPSPFSSRRRKCNEVSPFLDLRKVCLRKGEPSNQQQQQQQQQMGCKMERNVNSLQKTESMASGDLNDGLLLLRAQSEPLGAAFGTHNKSEALDTLPRTPSPSPPRRCFTINDADANTNTNTNNNDNNNNNNNNNSDDILHLHVPTTARYNSDPLHIHVHQDARTEMCKDVEKMSTCNTRVYIGPQVSTTTTMTTTTVRPTQVTAPAAWNKLSPLVFNNPPCLYRPAYPLRATGVSYPVRASADVLHF
ncbi:hypothetical protein RFI_17451 [Reticulomyxa filosa]|uniref:Uncharacterized protein n=1 Tax=Reticulomyxa filosa TaxID=46433 RepID=X6N1J3_RETFI|nr:hypothetical protein RFI_17451 [Reticulomyxa filosa]|eukprot:ETO19778.1 hypothetical protein RFI_17451 [Reticulomyxa filosa]